MPLSDCAGLNPDAAFDSATPGIYGMLAGFTAGSMFEVGEVFLKDLSNMESWGQSSCEILLASLVGGLVFRTIPVAFRFVRLRLGPVASHVSDGRPNG